MQTRKCYIRILWLVTMVFFLAGCGKSLKDRVRIGDYQLRYATLTGPRSAEVGLSLQIDNGTTSFQLYDVSGLIRDADVPLAEFAVHPEPIRIKGHRSQTQDVTIEFQLLEGVSLIRAMNLLSGKGLSGLVVDADARLRTHGIRKKLSYRDQALSKYLK